MEELSIEEKAKAYDEALSVAQETYTTQPMYRDWLAKMFPELAESKDERIRKELIEHIKANYEADYVLFKKFSPDDVIAWLEKQSESKTDCPQNHQDVNHPNGCIVKADFNGGEGFYKVNLDYLNKKQVEEIEEMIRVWNKEISNNGNIKHCVSMCLTDADEQRFKDYGTNLKDCLAWLEKHDANKEYVFRPLAGTMIENAVEQALEQGDVVLAFNGFYTPVKGKTSEEILTEYDNWIEKQSEQPTDKIEPKFKVGDWIVDDETPNDVFCVIEVLGEIYKVIDIDGDDYRIPHCKVNKQFHLWTIEDAKEGDVLVNGSNIFIFHFLNDTRLMGYCHVNTDNGRFYDDTGRNECFCLIDAEVSPATKEHHDLLFQKMKDAEYEWDNEKKELKKIEDKTLDADKVIEWLKTHGNLVPIVTIKINEVIDKFKQDFRIC